MRSRWWRCLVSCAWLVTTTSIAACSSSDEEKAEKQRECDSIEDAIHAAADARSLPRQGACNNPAAPEFGEACTKLSRCRRDLAEM